jgi:hypothetical protein
VHSSQCEYVTLDCQPQLPVSWTLITATARTTARMLDNYPILCGHVCACAICATSRKGASSSQCLFKIVQYCKVRLGPKSNNRYLDELRCPSRGAISPTVQGTKCDRDSHSFWRRRCDNIHMMLTETVLLPARLLSEWRILCSHR